MTFFLVNIGVLIKPVTSHNHHLFTKTQLFVHNHMQGERKRIDLM